MRDRFDKICLLAIVVTLIAIVAFASGFVRSDKNRVGDERGPAVERAIQEQVRANFLLETFEPVEQLKEKREYAAALLKVQELEKSYPGEPHLQILRGSILVEQGALTEGIARYAAAVRVNGDYVDANSRLNRRTEITRLVEDSLPGIKSSLEADPNPTYKKALKTLYYLQSRLAGGCE
ncbi:MAG: hypothetical protein C0615_02095 [Desulfuromonas sp.]|nr:MAG: hypothetical protein C0615_02095 [Desulfuromonas sp.]